MIRILVVDDMASVAEALAEILRECGMDVVGIAVDGEEALCLTHLLEPDVVLMDLRMPGMDGIKATRRITAEGLPSKVVMMTAYEDESLIRAATDAGASGYLVKGTLVSDTIAAIEAIAER